MAKDDKVETSRGLPEVKTERSLGLPKVKYARFYQPVQFVGHINGVHNDTSKLPKVDMEYDMIGVRITYDSRTIVIGWPNIVYVELA